MPDSLMHQANLACGWRSYAVMQRVLTLLGVMTSEENLNNGGGNANDRNQTSIRGGQQRALSVLFSYFPAAAGEQR